MVPAKMITIAFNFETRYNGDVSFPELFHVKLNVDGKF